MSLNKSTKDQIKFLKAHPGVVARLFELNANGYTTYTVHEKLNQEFSSLHDAVRITSGTTRRLLHRDKPFTDPALYSLVSPKDAEAVENRFRNIPRQPKKYIRQPQVPEPVPTLKTQPTSDEKQSCFHDVLKTRVAYENSLKAAAALGMDVERIRENCDLIVEDLLSED